MLRAALAGILVVIASFSGIPANRASASPGLENANVTARPLVCARASAAQRAPFECASELARFAQPCAGAPAGALTAAPQRPRHAPAPDRRNERRDPNRSATSSTARIAHRPPTQRSKAPGRSSPAMPGMGLLLRIGAGEARELSLNQDRPAFKPSHLLAGRAPPRAPTSLDFARDPIACAAALTPHTDRVRVPAPDAPFPTRSLTASSATAHSARGPALACAVAAGVGPDCTRERPGRSRAARRKGTPALKSPPFPGDFRS